MQVTWPWHGLLGFTQVKGEWVINCLMRELRTALFNDVWHWWLLQSSCKSFSTLIYHTSSLPCFISRHNFLLHLFSRVTYGLLLLATVLWIALDTAQQGTKQIVSFFGLLLLVFLMLLFSKHPFKVRPAFPHQHTTIQTYTLSDEFIFHYICSALSEFCYGGSGYSLSLPCWASGPHLA